MKRFLTICFLFLVFVSCFGNAGVFRGSGQTPALGKTDQIQMVEEEIIMFPRRGDYPVDTSCRNLDKMDFRCRFILRNLSDKKVVIPVGFPLDTEKISEDDLYKILTVIRDAPKPLLIHCWHGSDRTGCAVAAYRIVFENWSVEDAISELMNPKYGHHKNIYTNIPALLRKADWKKIKATVL